MWKSSINKPPLFSARDFTEFSRLELSEYHGKQVKLRGFGGGVKSRPSKDKHQQFVQE